MMLQPARDNSSFSPRTCTRPVRNVKTSHIGIDSQNNELVFSLYAAIKRELKAVDALFKQCKSNSVFL